MTSRPSEQDPLKEHRLDGSTVSAGCLGCPLLTQCGGYTRAGGGWSCLDRCVGCSDECDLVCLKKGDHLVEAMAEVKGFEHWSLPELKSPTSQLPRYIPVLQRGVTTTAPLEWAAIPFNALMRTGGDGRYAPLARTGAELRSRFGLSGETKIVLLGTGRDTLIETYWRWRRRYEVPALLRDLDLVAGISPNYSFFLEDPRPQHLFNRKRSLICASEWSSAGIPSIPYLHAVSSADWRYWEDFLTARPGVTYVAKEFQTGLRSRERGVRALNEIARLQERIGRELHVIAVGAAQYRFDLAARFDDWTVLDSAPFMKAVKRLAAVRHNDRRVTWEKAPDEDMGELLAQNASLYRRWIERARHDVAVRTDAA